MDGEITPPPSEQERRALLQALQEGTRGAAPAPPRRRAGLRPRPEEEDDQALPAAAPRQRAEWRGVAAAARDAPVEPVRGHRGREDRCGPVVVTVEVQRVQQDDEGDGGGARNRQAVRKTHAGENTGRMAVFSKVLVANRG